MINNEWLTIILLVVAAASFGVGAVWQTQRRRKAYMEEHLRRRRRHRDVVRARPETSVAKEVAPRPVAPTPERSVGVQRPALLAITEVSGSVEAAEVFIQRALSIEEDHFRAIPVAPLDLKRLRGLFERVDTLAFYPDGPFSRQYYSVSFAPAIEKAMGYGVKPRVTASVMDLQVVALSADSQVIGSPMGVPENDWGDVSRIQLLWELFNPAEHPHELEELLKYEIREIESRLKRVQLLAHAVEGRAWSMYWDTFFDLSRDARRLGAQKGRALDRIMRIDELARAMRQENRNIDAELQKLTQSMVDVKSADEALNSAIPLMYERELGILFLRGIAILRVMTGDDYTHGMRCSSHIAINVKRYPEVTALLDRARAVALDAVTRKGVALDAEEMAIITKLKKDVDELRNVHDETLRNLKKDIASMQLAIDQHLLLQERPRRFAVRMDEHGVLDGLFVLEYE